MRIQRLEIALLASLAACAGGDPVAMLQSSVVTINIYDFYYTPTGTTVRSFRRADHRYYKNGMQTARISFTQTDRRTGQGNRRPRRSSHLYGRHSERNPRYPDICGSRWRHGG